MSLCLSVLVLDYLDHRVEVSDLEWYVRGPPSDGD